MSGVDILIFEFLSLKFGWDLAFGAWNFNEIDYLLQRGNPAVAL